MSKNESILIVNKAREAAACAEANCASSFTNATNAAISATNAANSETAAAASAAAAATSETNTENLWEQFNALYLGSFAVAPTTDNQGNPLQEGALYWNSVTNEMFVWNGSAWTPDAFNQFTNFTATGTTTARNLVTRMADVVNVLDFGADPTGAVNSSTSFQDALNTNKNVYVPKGNYLINNMITVQNGQMLFGDSPTQSVIQIKTSTVNMSALGIVKLGTGTSLSQQEPAGRIENIGFNSDINTTITVRASVPNLPPMIYADNAPRGYINNIKIIRAWDGIKLINNCGGFFIGRVEIGALNIGINIVEGTSYSADFIQGDNWHFWPFGYAGTPIYSNVWKDGQTTAFLNGKVDGLNIGKISTFNAKIISQHPSTSIGGNIGTLQLDGSQSILEFQNGALQIGECYSTSGIDSLNPFINQAGGRLFINNLYYVGIGTSDQISVTGGYLQINGGFLNYVTPSESLINVSGGTLNLNNVKLEMPSSARTVPYIKQTGGGLQLINCTSTKPGHEILNCSVDSSDNIIDGDFLSPNIINLPSTIYNGKYQIQKSFQASVIPQTIGDWSVVYGVRTGQMRIDRDWFDFWLRLEFTPTFTTSSGGLIITGLPFQVQNVSEMAINFYEGITFLSPRTSISGRFLTTATNIALFESGNATNIDTTNITSGVKVSLLFTGRSLL